MKLDPESRRLLTVEKLAQDGKTVTGEVCDINGKPLGNSAPPIPVYSDTTGKAWARVAAVMPSNQDEQSKAAKAAILELNPVFFDGASGEIRGWYVPAPDFTFHPAPEPAPAA
jgi:hypothetical protein